MARADKHATELREVLEGASFAMSRIQYLQRITRLRVRQAHDRTGLDELLGGALEELDDMANALRSARDQVDHALAMILE